MLLAATPAAAETSCPATHDGAPLATVMMFDGPLEEHADLMPDTSRRVRGGTLSEWDVAYIFKAGRQLFVRCDYGPNRPPLVIQPAPSTQRCDLFVHGRTSLTCR